jgi:chemotaxis protein methyltransferase CheR
MIEFNDLEEIVFLIKKQYGYDFEGYSRFFLRRINRYMELSNIDSVFYLKNELINNPEKL